MLREETVFGPIHSRRLGNSLGINLLPTRGKFCNFDCIYCECGWNRDGLDDRRLPEADEVRDILSARLDEMKRVGMPIDSITFSGDGESTLHPSFPRIIDDTLVLRDRYFPQAKVSVLSNATRAHVQSVFEALKKVDNPIMKLDAPTNELIGRINHPYPGYDVNKVVEALRKFEGNFVLQTMMLRKSGFDSTSHEVIDGWMDIVRELHPREIMVYTIDRPTPEQGLMKISVEEMAKAVQPLIDEGFLIQIKG